MKRSLILLLSVSLIAGCKQREGSGEEESGAAKTEFVREKNMVDTMVLKKGDFYKQIISNGKLRAVQKSELSLHTSGVVEEVFFKNGDRVNAGEVIARLDPKQALYKIRMAQERLEKSELDLANELLGYGYGKDTANVPKNMLRIIKIRTGYSTSLNELSQAREDLENLSLKAPFAGKLANFSAKPFEQVSGIVCLLIDDSRFEVEFPLLEGEIKYVKPGSRIRLSSYNEPEKFYNGTVTQINPLVDEKGQIKVLAVVDNTLGRLMEGMNVKVFLENLVRDRLVVPKSAVVMRDNFDVLFRVDPATGRAMWTYVTIEMSNSDSHSVVANKEKNAELNPGDVVIISGNLNLAEGSNVEIKKR